MFWRPHFQDCSDITRSTTWAKITYLNESQGRIILYEVLLSFLIGITCHENQEWVLVLLRREMTKVLLPTRACFWWGVWRCFYKARKLFLKSTGRWSCIAGSAMKPRIFLEPFAEIKSARGFSFLLVNDCSITWLGDSFLYSSCRR